MNTFGSFPKSTPTSAMEVALDVMPLELFCQQEALAARCRLNDVITSNWDGKSHTKTHATGHLRHWAEIMADYKIEPSNLDRCSVAKWNPYYRINYDSFNGEAKHRTLTQINVFTDGSKRDDKTLSLIHI